MTSAGDRAKAKAARLAAGTRAPAVLSDQDERQPVAKLPAVRAERAETIKTSLHLAPELHRQYTGWLLEAARELDRGRIDGSKPLRVLLRKLLSDEELQAEVIEALRAEGRR